MIAHGEAGPLRILSNHNPVQLRLDAHDVLWPSCGNQALSLADSVLVNTGVCAHNLAVLGDDVARPVRLDSRVLFHKVGVGSALHEADLLRLRLLGSRQSPEPRNLANLRLGQIAQREDGLRELVLGHPEEKIRLILVPIPAAQQEPSAQRLVILYARVVTGCDTVGSNAGCLFDQVMELHVVVAEDAGARRLAVEIGLHERANDGIFKVLLQIQDVVRNSDLRGHTPGVPQIVQ